VSFRGELQGIEAVSWGLFGKEPNGLNESESSILASLIPSPNAATEDIIRRAVLLGTSLKVRTGSREIESLAYQSLTKPYTIKRNENLAPHVASMLLGKDVLSVTSSIDAGLQRFAIETLEKYISELQNQNVSEGAIIVVDNRTGEVLAYVANRGNKSSSHYVDGLQAKRQAGSTLKPFLYAIAFENRLLTPASLIKDEPLDIPTERGLYAPDNYDKQFRGIVTARTALASSLNVPAVKIGMLVGSELFAGKLKELEIGGIEGGEFYGPSIALGSVDVSLWELVNAYRTLANSGVWSQMTLTPGNKGGQSYRVYSKEAVFLVSDILSDREARGITFGLENPLSTKFWTAVKTGTSKDMRDNWCVGYSDKFTVGVWVGNFNNEPMWNVSGVSGAAPVWIEIINYLHKNTKSLPPLPPSNVIAKEIIVVDNEKKKKEWFIKGTEPEIALQAGTPAPKILYPSSGTIIAFDPDIPVEYQKIFFESNLESEMAKWLLNGKHLGSSSIMPWVPVRGTYELALVDKDNYVLDRITFEVR
jgi:penicillin-binding protein 1C